jgi:hypothetical protein
MAALTTPSGAGSWCTSSVTRSVTASHSLTGPPPEVDACQAPSTILLWMFLTAPISAPAAYPPITMAINAPRLLTPTLSKMAEM